MELAFSLQSLAESCVLPWEEEGCFTLAFYSSHLSKHCSLLQSVVNQWMTSLFLLQNNHAALLPECVFWIVFYLLIFKFIWEKKEILDFTSTGGKWCLLKGHHLVFTPHSYSISVILCSCALLSLLNCHMYINIKVSHMLHKSMVKESALQLPHIKKKWCKNQNYTT